MTTTSHLWLRQEARYGEARTVLTPGDAATLVAHGIRVSVEASDYRAIPNSAYAEAGCDIQTDMDWRNAPSDAVIVGLKGFDQSSLPLRHRHVHFAHAFKYQSGWQSTLAPFIQGGGALYDLEYLVDENGARVAAFGYWAGYVGAAMGVMSWVCQQQGARLVGPLQPWPNADVLADDVLMALDSVPADSLPEILVIGEGGRCGRGAIDMCKALGLPVTGWGRKDTAAGGPFNELLAVDLLINCVFVDAPLSPFTTLQQISQPSRQLSVIADVSCDPTGPTNPLPVYDQATDLQEPVVRVVDPHDNRRALDIMAIDHLPSLLPLESTIDFSRQLLPHLLAIGDMSSGVWGRARQRFDERVAHLNNDTATVLSQGRSS